MDNLTQKISNSTKWSAMAEVAAKLVLPVVNIILARLLTPEMFGIVTTVNIAITFAEIFQDAGFQKYIIQHEFHSEEEFDQNANVAFWTNLLLSAIIWAIIVFFRNEIALLIGETNLGTEVAVASISLPIFAMSSIQTSYLKRNFDYRKLFWVRTITAAIPLVVTVPLAIVLHNHWAMIIGTIARNAIHAVVLYVGAAWHPKLYYSFQHLKQMISFCVWSLLESVSIWLTANISILIVTHIMGTEIVGYYKTSMAAVTSITGIVSAATLSVLFSALSRLQNNNNQMQKVFYDFQMVVAMFTIPMGTGIWLYRDLIVRILLGEAWMKCADFVGMYGFAMSIAIVTNSFYSELYRANGKPKLSMVAQILYLGLQIPMITVACQMGFDALCISTTVLMFCFLGIHLAISKRKFGMGAITMLRNFIPIFAAAGIMSAVSILLRFFANSLVWDFVSILVCIAVYAAMLICIKPLREMIRTSDFTSHLYGAFVSKIREKAKRR